MGTRTDGDGSVTAKLGLESVKKIPVQTTADDVSSKVCLWPIYQYLSKLFTSKEFGELMLLMMTMMITI